MPTYHSILYSFTVFIASLSPVKILSICLLIDSVRFSFASVHICSMSCSCSPFSFFSASAHHIIYHVIFHIMQSPYSLPPTYPIVYLLTTNKHTYKQAMAISRAELRRRSWTNKRTKHKHCCRRSTPYTFCYNKHTRWNKGNFKIILL